MKTLRHNPSLVLMRALNSSLKELSARRHKFVEECENRPRIGTVHCTYYKSVPKRMVYERQHPFVAIWRVLYRRAADLGTQWMNIRDLTEAKTLVIQLHIPDSDLQIHNNEKKTLLVEMLSSF